MCIATFRCTKAWHIPCYIVGCVLNGVGVGIIGVHLCKLSGYYATNFNHKEQRYINFIEGNIMVAVPIL